MKKDAFVSTNTSLKRRALVGSTALVAVALLASQPAFAQQAAAADTAAGDEETIVVTGSLIKNPNLVLSSPVNVIGEREIATRQINNAEQLLRDLPGVVPSIGSAVNNGNNGASFVNLRGLGFQRNLVLIDGDRLVPADQGGAFDLNNIPLALVSRVDVLTGGASTTYGADAVSGVVNFVTKQNFTGFDARMSYGLTERGDGNTLRADVTIGGDFADGKGNAVLSFGYQKVDPVFQGDRDFSLFQVTSTGARGGRAAGGSFTNTPTTFQASADPDTGRAAYNLQNNFAGTDFVAQNLDGFNFAPFNIFQTPFERFNVFAQAKYEIADGIEVYTRGMFSKNSVKTVIAPSGIFGQSLNVNINNPFIAPAQRSALCAANSQLDCSAGSTAILNIPTVYRRSVEVGPRTSNYVTTMFDYKVGVRGQITDAIDFDIHGAYGQNSLVQNLDGYILTSRVQQALLADNATTCRVAAGGCVPLNFFGGPGSITPAMVSFIRGQSTSQIDTGLGQVRGVISGDTGITSPLAANGISFAVGAEHRNNTYSRNPDSLSRVPGELGGGAQILPFQGGYSVTEGFAEVNVPLVEDKPFFQSLSAEAGVRQSSYKVRAAGNPSFNATTYKGGLAWSPVDGVKLRTSYARAVRAPNIGELFGPVITGLTSLSIDPCSGSKPVGNANLTAICIAQGATASQIGSITDPTAGQANATGGGDINIQPEVADTFTIGGVLTPSFAPGLSITVDYFNVKINSAISTRTPDDTLAACFGTVTAASATSVACQQIFRTRTTGGLSGGGGAFAGLLRPLTNLGRFDTSGIDLSAAYTADAGFATVSFNLNGTYTIASRFRAAPTSINRECVGQYSVNCGVTGGGIQPKWSHNFRTTFDFGGVNVSALWRYIGPVEYERILPRVFSGTITGSGPLVGRTFNFNKISDYNFFDLAAGFKVMDNISLDMLVSNLFDRQPPIVGSTLGTTGQNSGNTYPSTYDTLGRRYTITLGVRF